MINRLIFWLAQLIAWLERYNEERSKRQEQRRRAHSIRLAKVELEKLARMGIY